MNVRGYVLRGGMLAVVLVAGVLSVEWFLAWRYERIARSDRITSGLTRPDLRLGWRPSRGWNGHHRHADFEADYSINRSGFRGADAAVHPPQSQMIAVMGDSFAFGIGVNDAEVFTHLLDERSSPAARVYNFAVPGFSTDQELLLAESDVLPLKPKVLVLVVYLANDLFDNQLPESLQVRHPKPMFVLENGGLSLKSSQAGPADDGSSRPTLLGMVLGTGADGGSAWQRWTARSHLFQLLEDSVLPARTEDPAFATRHAYGLSLFWAIVNRLRDQSEAVGTRVVLALLAGRSFVERPSSLSARYQEFFRRRLADGAASRGFDVVDLAMAMESRRAESGAQWFFPHEGHLNAEGHRFMAEVVGAALAGSTMPSAGPR